jgi:hypothetical protein
MKKNITMKHYINFYTGMVMLLIPALISCDNDWDKMAINPVAAPENVAVNTTVPFECTPENAADIAYTFSWSKADLGHYIAPVYTLQFDVAGNDFASPTEIVAGNNVYSRAVTSNEMNNVMHGLGQPIDISTDIEVRVKALPMVSGSAQPVLTPVFSSSKVTISLTSYAMKPLHMLGSMFDNYLEDPSMVYFFNVSNYKYVMFRDNPLAPDVCVAQLKAVDGTGLQGQMVFIEDENLGGLPLSKDTEGTLKAGWGANIDITTPGYHEVKVVARKMYTVTPYDASNAVSYTSLQLSGSGAAAAVTMQPSHYDPHIWEADNVSLVIGDVTFTANGGTVWGGQTFPWGTGVVDDENIHVSKAGNYFIKFNDLTKHYVFYQH